jgi:hypothetical protein
LRAPREVVKGLRIAARRGLDREAAAVSDIRTGRGGSELGQEEKEEHASNLLTAFWIRVWSPAAMGASFGMWDGQSSPKPALCYHPCFAFTEVFF